MATIYDWATQASGSTIVGSLTATAAEYQGQITIGTVTYGLIKYTFSGSPTLSSVIAGHRLTITGMINSLNNASGMIVYSADDSADTITVRSTVRTDATANETGASGTGTVTTAGAAVQKPSDSYIEQGFAAPGKPSDAYWNWVVSQMASIVQSVDSRASNIYAGPSQISSSSYADLDGAGVPYGLANTGSDQSWTASANDGAYETLGAGSNLDPIIKTGSDVLYILTHQQANGISKPIDFQLEIDGTPVQEVTNDTGSGGSAQIPFSYSWAHVESSVTVGTRDFDPQAARLTGLNATKVRATAIELPAQDDDLNNLVRAYTNEITAVSGFTSTSYADLTGFTTGSQAYQSGNKALILFGAECYGSNFLTLKLQKDGGTEIEYGTTQLNVTNRPRTVVFSRVADVTGSHTFKVQGKLQTTNSTAYSSGSNGYFGAIELPAEYNGDTLIRSVVDASDTGFTATSLTEIATSGSVTTNGHGFLMLLSGNVQAPGGSTSLTIQFKVDGGAHGSAYPMTASGADDFMCNLMLWVPALSAGSHTFSVDAQVSGGSWDFVGLQFAALEMPITDPDAGSAPTVTLTNTTGKKVELTYTGKASASNAALSFQVTENIDGGGAVADGKEFTFTPQANEDTPFAFRTVVDAPTSGSTAVYKLQGKIASGTANISAGDFMAREIAADGS